MVTSVPVSYAFIQAIVSEGISVMVQGVSFEGIPYTNTNTILFSFNGGLPSQRSVRSSNDLASSTP